MPEKRFKIVFLGEQSVGKTSIVTRFMNDRFEDAYSATIGIDFLSKTVFVKDTTVRLQIWDTAGQERFHSLIPAYIRDCSAAIIVYDVSNEESFHWVDKWMRDVKTQREGSGRAVVALVGNKVEAFYECFTHDIRLLRMAHADLQSREVTHEEGVKRAHDCAADALFFETSAKTGQNVRKLFHAIAEQLLEAKSDSMDDDSSDEGHVIYQASTVDLSIPDEPHIPLDGRELNLKSDRSGSFCLSC